MIIIIVYLLQTCLTAAALYALTRKHSIYICGDKDQTVLNSFKKIIASDVVLTHYDPAKKIGVGTDASDYGIVAILFHSESKGVERPMCFASRILSDAERNY